MIKSYFEIKLNFLSIPIMAYIRFIFVLIYFTQSILSCSPKDWEKTDYIWNFGLRNICTVGVESTPQEYFKTVEYPFHLCQYQKIQKNDLVWIRPTFVEMFYREILPHLNESIVLLINDGDETFPKNCGLTPTEVEYFLGHPKIKHIFCQNLDYWGESKKITPIPIGIDFHSIAYKGGYWGENGSPSAQEHFLKRVIASSPPTSERKKRIFVDFQHSESMRASFSRYLEFHEDRRSIFKKILKTGLVDFTKKLSRNKLWKIKGQYAFSVSPWGNGLDCHRTWEDLALGCIVIVKTSPLDPLYKDLPVVIIQDWDEITKENLDKWMNLFPDASNNPKFRKRLKNTFWIEKIMESLKV
ncbi:MAG: hypothetical protein FJZ60_01840 [Chlamydiae bacterium]|nr:hypothetical protein [Chlamydiota bacterium]